MIPSLNILLYNGNGNEDFTLQADGVSTTVIPEVC
jgi:hypothetical protein